MTTFLRLPRVILSSRLVLVVLLALLLAIVPNAPAARATATSAHLYIPSSAAGKLIKSNLDGTSPTNALTIVQPTGIAIDVKHGHMYIATIGGTVTRYDLDGMNPAQLNFTGVTLSFPMGIALDLVHEKIYVVSRNSHSIIKADLTGANATELFLSNKLNTPWDIALDVLHDKMYVTNYGGPPANPAVVTATLDGLGAAAVNFGTVTFNSPTGIALDFYHGKMYVADYGTDSVIRSDLDGSNAATLTNLGTSIKHPSGIAVDPHADKIYIASTGDSLTIPAIPDKIIRANLDGASPTDLAAGWTIGLLNMPYFLAFDTPPDLSIRLWAAPSSVVAGNGFDWTIQVINWGPNPAVFGPGQTILRDELPLGPIYGTPTITDHYTIANTGAILCDFFSPNVLTCVEGGGTGSFNPGFGGMLMHVAVTTPNTPGTLANPKSGGVCQADPHGVITEINYANNSCSSTVPVTAPALPPRGQNLYVLNSAQAVSRANLDGSGGVNLGNPSGLVDTAQEIALDTEHDWMYLTNSTQGKIIRAHLNGTGAEDLGNLGGQLTQAEGIALDVANDHLYVASWNQNKIFRAHLDGTFINEIANLTGKVNGVDAIAVDLVHTRLYVAGSASNNVYRLSQGGEELELTGLNGLLTHPESIAVDAYSGYLFVVDTSSVVRSDLDGNGAVKLTALSSLCAQPRGIAVGGSGHIYVACSGVNRVIRADLDGSNVKDLGSLNDTVYSPYAIAIDPRGFLALPFVTR